jgi:hypothetical protein
MAFTKQTPISVSATMVHADTGVPLTVGVAVQTWKDNAPSVVSGQGTLAHMAAGVWRYIPTASEFDGDSVHFIFSHANGITQVRELYPDSEILSTKEFFDWSDAEQMQIRKALGIAGPKGQVEPTTGHLQDIKSKSDRLTFNPSDHVASDQKSIDGSLPAAVLARLLADAGMPTGVVTNNITATSAKFSTDIVQPSGFHELAYCMFLTGGNASQKRRIQIYGNHGGYGSIDVATDAAWAFVPAIGDQHVIIGRSA